MSDIIISFLVIYVVINLFRALVSPCLYDDDFGHSGYIKNFYAITYINCDRLNILGITITLLADLFLLPGALLGTILYGIAGIVIYMFHRFCIKH